VGWGRLAKVYTRMECLYVCLWTCKTTTISRTTCQWLSICLFGQAGYFGGLPSLFMGHSSLLRGWAACLKPTTCHCLSVWAGNARGCDSKLQCSLFMNNQENVDSTTAILTTVILPYNYSPTIMICHFVYYVNSTTAVLPNRLG